MSTEKKRTPNKIHMGRVMLHMHGCSVSELARKSFMTQSGITHQLAGKRRVSRPVWDAMVELIGQDAAAEVVAAIPKRDKAYAR